MIDFLDTAPLPFGYVLNTKLNLMETIDTEPMQNTVKPLDNLGFAFLISCSLISLIAHCCNGQTFKPRSEVEKLFKK